MTPYELGLVITEFNERQKLDDQEKVVLTYLGAYLQRVEKMPPLKQLLERSAEKAVTPENMLDQVKSLNTMFGGVTI